jgi:tetratricopeptide (TPR) repeat protein
MDAALMGAPDIIRGGEPIMGFSEIAEKYADQEAGKTAALNAGKIYLDRGDTDNALKMFNIAEESDAMLTILGATAGKAATLEEKGDYDEAAQLYLKASKLSQATNIKQKYLYYAGLNSSMAGEGDKAGTLLNDAIKLSPAAQWANMARAELGRLGMKIAY